MENDIEENQRLLNTGERCRRLGVSTQAPKYPNYAVLSRRFESFKAWPQHVPIGKAALVDAGLVYTGVGDAVRCYHCGGGLRNWEPGDNPMLEHAKWYPTCPHVLLVKGQEYIDAAGRGEDLDAIAASKGKKNRSELKSDIKSVAAQSCLEFGHTVDEVKRAMATYIAKKGADDYTARDLLQLILEDEEGEEGEGEEPEMAAAGGASSNTANTIDCRARAMSAMTETEEQEDEEEIQRMKEENRRIKEQQLCKICLEEQSSVIFLPCGHLVACPQCAPALLKCPLCRLEVQGQVRAYLS